MFDILIEKLNSSTVEWTPMAADGQLEWRVNDGVRFDFDAVGVSTEQTKNVFRKHRRRAHVSAFLAFEHHLMSDCCGEPGSVPEEKHNLYDLKHENRY